MLHVFNTLTGKKESFKPLNDNQVHLYVCGITPYDYAHLGHGRCYVSFDLLVRLLTFMGYTVTYGRNFTDIDDKILHKAERDLGDMHRYPEITNKYINAFHEDIKSLNCLPAHYEPRVTLMIPHIIAFIEQLIKKGHAYVKDGDVYFAVDTYAQYGKLSKHKTEDLIAGQRIEPSAKKNNPLDFALWKGVSDNTFFKSPWGYGRPGWHIECSVMAADLFGKTFDIHGGGRDLIFPHHENEIAQSEGLYQVPMARYWMHNGFVQINNEKMSKSLGNFFTLQDIFQEADAMLVRYYFVAHHYRAPLEFSFQDLKALEKSYKRLTRVFDVICPQLTIKQILASQVVQKMLTFLYDDLNTPGMFGVLFDHLEYLQTNQAELCAVKAFIQQVVGLTLAPLPEQEAHITPEIQALLDEREQARARKDWKRADELRVQLHELGIGVTDKKT